MRMMVVGCFFLPPLVATGRFMREGLLGGEGGWRSGRKKKSQKYIFFMGSLCVIGKKNRNLHIPHSSAKARLLHF